MPEIADERLIDNICKIRPDMVIIICIGSSGKVDSRPVSRQEGGLTAV